MKPRRPPTVFDVPQSASECAIFILFFFIHHFLLTANPEDNMTVEKYLEAKFEEMIKV